MSTLNTTSADVRKVKNVSSNTKILSTNNPEIFDTSPRPGGFLKVMVPTKSQDYIAESPCHECPVSSKPTPSRPVSSKRSASSIDSSFSKSSKVVDKPRSIKETSSREFRLKRALEESDWELTAVDETETVLGITNPLQDSINMLAVTISCVMLLGAKVDVSLEYLLWAEEYLKCIKDDFGEYPPNIASILQEITKAKKLVADKGPSPGSPRRASDGSAKSDTKKSGRRGSASTATKPKVPDDVGVVTLTTATPKETSKQKVD